MLLFFQKNMKISLQNNNLPPDPKAVVKEEILLKSNQSLLNENLSIIKSSEDILTLSATAIKAFFKSQTLTQEQSISKKNSQGSTISAFPDNNPSALEINGSSNKIFDSAGNDLAYVKGNSNQLNSSQGNDALLLIGKKNKLQGYNNSIQTAILGDSNQVKISGSGSLTAAIKGNTNLVTSDTGNDFLILDGKRNNISTGSGEDSIITYGNDHLINAGAGKDVVISKGNNFNISAGEGDDLISTNGSGKINGEDGNDTIEITGSKNTAYGGKGDDTIIFSSTGNTINGDEGDDTFQVQLAEGSVTINGGKDNDTIQLAIKRADYSIINGANDVSFYNLSNHSKKLKITYTDIENFQFSDGETLTLDELKNSKGLTYQINELKDKSRVKNSDPATNVLDLNVPVENITKSVKSSTGVKISYINSQNQNRTIQVQGFDFLKVAEDQYIDLKSAPNFEYLDISPSETYAISTETSSGRYQTNFYDKTNENLLLSKSYTEKGSNFLFKNGSFLSATELLSSFSGNSIDVSIDETVVNPTSPIINTANLKFSSDKIYHINKVAPDTYDLKYKISDTETGTITLQSISSIITEEGDQLSLASIYQNSANIRKNEKSHTVFASDSQDTEFKRIAYQLTGNISYLESLIDGSYENLSDSEKSVVISNAAILENSLNFSSDYSDKKVDEATKKLYTLRVSNLLRNRSDVLQNLTDSGLFVYFTKNKDLGGNSTGFTAGTASFTDNGNKSKYEIKLVLSAFYGGIFDGNDGDSVDIHETLHILDFRDEKQDDGLPFGITGSASTNFKSERDDLFAQFNQSKQSVGAIRKYGFTNNQEFLAVTSENFYERPTELNSTSSLLYSALKEYFNA